MRLQCPSFLKAREVKRPSLRERVTLKNQRATGCTSLSDPRSPTCLPSGTGSGHTDLHFVLECAVAPYSLLYDVFTFLFPVKFFSLSPTFPWSWLKHNVSKVFLDHYPDPRQDEFPHQSLPWHCSLVCGICPLVILLLSV